MADKPSRALVLYGDGLARFVGPGHTHLHSFASRACCGFLALPHPPASENEDTRIIREFAELLDSSEAYGNFAAKELFEDKPQEKCTLTKIGDRFMGMKAAIVTDNSTFKSFGDKSGFSVLQWDSLVNKSDESSPLASGILKLLGFEEGKALDANPFDLVLVHVGANEKINDLESVKFLNNLVGELLQMAQSGTEIGSRLHTSIILSYGPTLEDDHVKFPVPKPESKNSELSGIIPRQSYMMKGGKTRENVRGYCPMIVAQYQNAVTRKDKVETFSYKDISENGCNLVIPADRFLHEVAFKLWKAPKYGA